MLVLVIIGLMSSAVVMTLPKDPPASRALSDTLLKEFNRNAQDSLLSARSAAFGVSKSSYAFYDYDGAEWISKDAQSWPDALQIHLIKEGEAVTLTDKLASFPKNLSRALLPTTRLFRRVCSHLNWARPRAAKSK